MSVKKALEGLDYVIEVKAQTRSLMVELLTKWCLDKDDIATNNVKLIFRSVLHDLSWLQAIRNQLLPEQHRIKIVCKHPKKDHDVCDGKKYCMNCNQDLE